MAGPVGAYAFTIKEAHSLNGGDLRVPLQLQKIRAELNARQPVGRLGRPDEMADLVLYLCSREAGFVTGSLMFIDGGTMA